MRFVPSNAQHVGRRDSQQDSFGFSAPDNEAFLEHAGFVAIVADGMGGMAHGDAASRLAVKAFLEAHATKASDEALPDALERAVLAANDAVYRMAAAAGVPGDAGATLIAAALRADGLHWISVGDSAIYLRRDGSLTRLTTSHNYAHDLDERARRGEISVEQALSDPQREALTSYVGARTLAKLDRNIRPIALQPGDSILLASDGLFRTLDDTQIAAAFAEAPDNTADLLVQRTLEAGKPHQDNVTVCIVAVEPGEAAAIVPPPETAVVAAPPPEPAPIAEEPLPNWIPEQQPDAAPPSKWKVYVTAAALALTIAGVALWKLYFAQSPVTAEKAPAVLYPAGDIRPGSLEPGSAPPVEKGNEEAAVPNGGVEN